VHIKGALVTASTILSWLVAIYCLFAGVDSFSGSRAHFPESKA